jgi:hypothetical protein
MGLQVKPLEIVELHSGRQSDSGVSYTRYGNWDGTRPILEGRVPVRLLTAHLNGFEYKNTWLVHPA